MSPKSLGIFPCSLMGASLCLLYTDIDFKKEVLHEKNIYKLRQDDEKAK